MTFIGLLTLFVLLGILHFLHKIVFCGIPFGPFIARPHGSDTEDFSLIRAEACALYGCGYSGFTGVLALGAALDQFPAGERRAADCLMERIFLHVRSPDGKSVYLVQDAGDLLISQDRRRFKFVPGKCQVRFSSFRHSAFALQNRHHSPQLKSPPPSYASFAL